MLEQIEGHSALAIQRDNFTIDQCIARKVRARLCDVRKILGEEIFAPRPEPYAVRIFSGETAVTVQLDFVHPVIAVVRQFRHRVCKHRLDEFYWRAWQ